jgi:hypothetical protein
MTNPTTGSDAGGQPVTVDPATGQPTVKPTAKVAAGAVVAGALIVVVAVLAAVTPDMLTFAGPWSPLIYAAVVALGGFLGGYIKRP